MQRVLINVRIEIQSTTESNRICLDIAAYSLGWPVSAQDAP